MMNRRQLFVLVATVLCLLGFRTAQAQVLNDDCANAEYRDALIFGGWDCVFPGGMYGLLIEDSTDQALVNFPYPINPNPCTGSFTTLSTLAQDRWYVLYPPASIQFLMRFTATDTCLVSWWQGNSCGSLMPLQCFTVIPGDTTYAMPGYLHGSGTDTLFLQVAGTPAAPAPHYWICYGPIQWVGAMNLYWNYAATPVTCAAVETTVSPATAVGVDDGSIHVQVTDGLPPYNILWMDGDTDFVRNDLMADVYTYILSTGGNCAQLDTVELLVDISTGGLVPASLPNLQVVQVDGQLTFSGMDPFTSGSLAILDMLGRVVLHGRVSGPSVSVDLGQLTSGIYCYCLTSTSGLVRTGVVFRSVH